jgi:AcrR family transcriptional regulator
MATARRPDGPARRRYAPRVPAEQRREQVLDAALRVIAERGYGGVSMEAVARETGVTKPVVYDLFPNIGVLLRTLLEREEERALSSLAALIPELALEGDPDDLLVSAFATFLGAVTDHPDAWRLILLPVEGTPEVVRRHTERGRREVVARIQQLLTWGLERRGGPTDIDFELAAHAMLAVGEHAGRLVLTDPENFTPERFSRFAAKLLAFVPRA